VTSRTLRLADILAIEVKEKMKTASIAGRKKEGLFFFLELLTREGERIITSLSYFDPQDARKERSFEQEITWLKARINK
jgi:hypothetical protein